MMSDELVPSRYVKLTKDQDTPLEEIRPGELNQPVHVPQLEVQRCNECGQPLPESYEPPADEAWTTGIFGCTDDPESCWTGLFCPCVLFGRNVERLREDTPWTGPCMCHAICVEGGLALAVATAVFHGIDPSTSFLIGEGLVFAWWMCGIYTGIFRQSLQKKYHLKVFLCKVFQKQLLTKQGKAVYNRCFPGTPHWREFRRLPSRFFKMQRHNMDLFNISLI